MSILLETNSSSTITFVFLLVVFGVIALVGGLSSSKKRKMRETTAADLLKKKATGDDDWFITTEKKVVCADIRCSKTACYEFPLEDIAYIMPVDLKNGAHQLGFYDSNKKTVKATKYEGGKTSNSKAFFNPTKHDPKVVALILANKPDAKLVGPYFKELN